MSEIERKIFVIQRSRSPFGRKKMELPRGKTVRTADKSAYIRVSQNGKAVTFEYDLREILRGTVLRTMEDGTLKKSSYYEEPGRFFAPHEYLATRVYAFSPRKRINEGKFLVRSEKIVPFTLRRIFGR